MKRPGPWRCPAHRDVRRRRVRQTLPTPRPPAWPAGGALLWLLPPCLQNQTRTHRLPHRAGFIHRPGECGAGKTAPRRRLPVLRSADEKVITAASRLEPQPRPATSATILCMNSAPVIPPTKIRFLQVHGQCDGDLCPTTRNDRQVIRFCPIQLDFPLRNPSASPLKKAVPPCGNDVYLELRPHLPDRLPTQNA